jgi:hypothetical protein
MNKTNEREINKKMIQTINEYKTIDKNNVTTDISSEDLNSELEQLRAINGSVEINSFKTFPEDKNVVMTGKFNNLGDFSFQMTLDNNDGLYIIANNVQLDKTVSDVLTKLRGHYKNWSNEWNQKIIDDYK